MKLVLASMFLCLVVDVMSQGAKSSMLNPPWKHCVHRLQARKSWQEFSSPGFPLGITTQTQCSWIITAPNSRRIQVAFQTLNLTGSINNCYTQFIEYWEVRTASSKGKFCGDRRPGDYVSTGPQLRIDLKADTAAAGHKGFLMKYRMTKEAGGFKKKHSFSKIKSPKSPKQKEKSADRSSLDTPAKIGLSGNNGGRVNLSQRQRLRQQATQIKKTPAPARNKVPAPIRSIQPVSNIQKILKPPPFKRDDISITFESDDVKGLQLWIIILIGVGGFLFLLIIALIGWLCFCRNKSNQKMPAPASTAVNQPINPEPLPTEKRQELPRSVPADHQIQHPVFQEIVLQSHQIADHAPPSRAPKKTSSTKSRVNDRELAGKRPFSRGFLYTAPNAQPGDDIRRLSAGYSSADDEGYGTPIMQRTQTQQQQQPTIPTLQRHYSQWEKDEIKRKSRKL